MIGGYFGNGKGIFHGDTKSPSLDQGIVTYKNLGKNGRLGNQLWQVASTLGIAFQNDMTYVLPEWEYAQHINPYLPQDNSFLPEFYYEEETTRFKEIKLSPGKWNINGYFQSYKYFDSPLAKNTLDYIFNVRPETFKYFRYQDTVAVHVRRGDYLNLSHIHYNLPESYYRKAFSYFPNETFTIFSDDTKWCEETFSDIDCVIVHKDHFAVDLFNIYAMSLCKGIIIANSSFSWWGAYLSKHTNIIAPNLWVAGENTVEDRIPKEWTVIDAN